MQYKVIGLSSSTCSIELIPVNDAEKQLLQNKEAEDTFTLYYQDAIEKHIHPNAVLLQSINTDKYPCLITARYSIASGIADR